MNYMALIGLGSNLNSPVKQLKTAIQSIADHPHIQLLKVSSFYQSLPQGPQDQDLFINAVAAINTSLEPKALLLTLQEIELNQGKVKLRHWGERCIDLDILFINQLMLHHNEPELIIPHPHALTRDFVLVPALEIEPEWALPDGGMLKDHLNDCLQHGLKKISEHA